SNAKEKILSEGIDELSIKRVVDKELQRKKIRDTNIGKDLQAQIDILKMLMHDRYLD
ncbi:fructose-bisphosphatase class III, partial [Staphylococcus aureus]